ncbi:MAG: VCBS repeat-containing protein [Planctomycetota bacterium]|nr:VCBS repeat-containing protein [Planctomycetota bacterium]
MPHAAQRFCATALTLLWLSACSDDQATSEAAPNANTETSSLLSASQDVGLDASADGWSTETLGDTAKAILEELIDIGTAPTSEQLLAHCSVDIAVGELRPEQLETIRDRDGFTVMRATGDRQPPRSGAQALASSLAQLFAPYDAAPTVHIKVTGVDLSAGPGGSTTALYQASGVSRGRSYQQSATWETRWNEAATLITSMTLLNYEEVHGPQAGGELFTEKTLGLFNTELESAEQFLPSLSHVAASVDMTVGAQITSSEGVSIGDVNGDGLEDVYFSQAKGMPNRLYLQGRDGSLFDGTSQAGIDLLDSSIASLLLDLDGDGDQDLIVSGNGVLFFENKGNLPADGQHPSIPRFELKVSLDITFTYSITACDYDLDRDLDFYICRYHDTQSTFPTPYHDAQNGPPNALLRNEGDWSFVDVTAEVGLQENNHRYSFASSWADFNSDGSPDLYVANDFGRNNLYQNEGGKFVDVAPQYGVEDISAGMSADWGDPDQDGDYDLYVGNMYSAAGNRIAYQRQFQPDASDEKLNTLKRHARGNSLFLNQGGAFTDESLSAAVTMGRWSWCSRFVDIDNDSMEDLVVTNGYITSDDATHDL